MTTTDINDNHVVRCHDCDIRIRYIGVTWVHVTTPDEPHRPTPACTCTADDRQAGIPHAWCRVHGVDDVVSGAYDANPRLRAHIDNELSGGDR